MSSHNSSRHVCLRLFHWETIASKCVSPRSSTAAGPSGCLKSQDGCFGTPGATDRPIGISPCNQLQSCMQVLHGQDTFCHYPGTMLHSPSPLVCDLQEVFQNLSLFWNSSLQSLIYPADGLVSRTNASQARPQPLYLLQLFRSSPFKIRFLESVLLCSFQQIGIHPPLLWGWDFQRRLILPYSHL